MREHTWSKRTHKASWVAQVGFPFSLCNCNRPLYSVMLSVEHGTPPRIEEPSRETVVDLAEWKGESAVIEILRFLPFVGNC